MAAKSSADTEVTPSIAERSTCSKFDCSEDWKRPLSKEKRSQPGKTAEFVIVLSVDKTKETTMGDLRDLTDGDLNKKLEKIYEDLLKFKRRQKEIQSSDAVIDLVEKQNLLRRIRNKRRNLEKVIFHFEVHFEFRKINTCSPNHINRN